MGQVLRAIATPIVSPFGYTVVPKASLIDWYLHEYESYEYYRSVQEHHNSRKLAKVWADETTLDRVAEIVAAAVGSRPVSGLCHGTRNGFEQRYLNAKGWIRAIGTDIGKTATEFENTVRWDFHDVNEEWRNRFDFVYSNALDQAWKPRIALTTWLNQVLPGTGVVILEHTEAHGPAAAGEMDPFGVRPVAMPYVLTEWFGGQIAISHSVGRKKGSGLQAWLFVCRKLVDTVA